MTKGIRGRRLERRSSHRARKPKCAVKRSACASVVTLNQAPAATG